MQSGESLCYQVLHGMPGLQCVVAHQSLCCPWLCWVVSRATSPLGGKEVRMERRMAGQALP